MPLKAMLSEKMKKRIRDTKGTDLLIGGGFKLNTSSLRPNIATRMGDQRSIKNGLTESSKARINIGMSGTGAKDTVSDIVKRFHFLRDSPLFKKLVEDERVRGGFSFKKALELALKKRGKN